MRSHKIFIRWFIVLVGFIGILAGCQSFGHAFGSQKIKTPHLLLIPRQGPLHIRWEARDLAIEFKGKVNQNILTIEGQIDIAGGANQHTNLLDRLVVDIYLSTPDGSILERHTFYSTDNSPPDDATQGMFKHSYELPKGTTHIAFGYDGAIRESGSKSSQNKGNTPERAFQHSPFL